MVEYLKTLPYKSLTELANALDTFLNHSDAEDDSINRWPELAAFLADYKDTDTLKNILDALYRKVTGDNPSDDFKDLRSIENFVRAFQQYVVQQDHNLQTELDQT